MLRPLTGMLVIAAFLAILAGPNAPAQEMEVDTFTGLKMSDDWELVRNNCIACHSLKLVTQQRGSATQWLSVIRWMQAKQNLWQLDPDTENRIINYLAENYPPQAEQRRTALAPQLMPPNPYAAESK
jgi:cytochrome c1